MPEKKTRIRIHSPTTIHGFSSLRSGTAPLSSFPSRRCLLPEFPGASLLFVMVIQWRWPLPLHEPREKTRRTAIFRLGRSDFYKLTVGDHPLCRIMKHLATLFYYVIDEELVYCIERAGKCGPGFVFFRLCLVAALPPGLICRNGIGRRDWLAVSCCLADRKKLQPEGRRIAIISYSPMPVALRRFSIATLCQKKTPDTRSPSSVLRLYYAPSLPSSPILHRSQVESSFPNDLTVPTPHLDIFPGFSGRLG